jgi:hypothetical protein
MVAARLVVIALVFVIAPTISVAQRRQVQKVPKQRTSVSASDLSSRVILSELKGRGLNPSKATTPQKLRDAFTQYDFEARGSGLNPNNKEFLEAAQNLSVDLSETSLQSHVTVRTKAPGARVWYRLIGGETDSPFNQLTNDTADDITIGLYYIWAERDGKPTSSKQLIFRVIKEQVPIDLVEAIP